MEAPAPSAAVNSDDPPHSEDYARVVKLERRLFEKLANVEHNITLLEEDYLAVSFFQVRRLIHRASSHF